MIMASHIWDKKGPSMVTAAAPAIALSEPAENALPVDIFGAQTLLKHNAPRPNYPAQGAAVLLYALALTGVVLLSRPTPETELETPLELVLAPAPVEEPPPPEEAVPEQADEIPPPPEAIDPVAPVEEPKPVPKPQPKPKVEKKVERKPRTDAAPRQATSATSASAGAPAQNASLSAIASQIHARLQRAAANAYPESQAPRSARIGYRVSFSASGAMTSFTIVPSGNAAFDAVASRLGGRIGSISPPGKPVSLSGSLTFSP
jgi:protein TonB